MCHVCCGPAAAPYALCFACRVVAARLGLPLAPVLPARLCPLPGPLYTVLLGYKESAVDEARRYFAGLVRALLAAFLAEHPDHKHEFNRLKGLGEMDFAELRDTTMDPERRSLLQVNVEQAALADEVCSILMGDDVELRRHFIQTNAKDVRFLDI